MKLVLALFPFLPMILYACNGGHPTPPPSSTFTYKTSEGAVVTSPVQVPEAVLDAIDRGIQTEIDKMPAEWQNARSAFDYPVQFRTPGAIAENGTPVIVLPGGTAAGMTVGDGCGRHMNGESGPLTIVVPHQAEMNWQYADWIQGVVWAEAEHIGEARNDCNEFLRWSGWGDTHPHRP